MKNKVYLSLLFVLTTCLFSDLRAQNRFGDNRKFRIMQVTDTHIIVGSKHSQSSIEMLSKALDSEKPDLVIFTGDVVTGKPYKAGFEMVIKPLLSRKIPWALVFGNHDHEQDLTYDQLAELIESYPSNIGKMKPVSGVSGYGNYTLEIKGRDGEKTKAVLYCMDSHSYSQMKPVVNGYGWLALDQVEWYRRTSDRYTSENN
jgi:predicted MPP superfamily phosphohydrolase